MVTLRINNIIPLRISIAQKVHSLKIKKRQMAKAILHQLLQSHSNEIKTDPSYRIGLSGPPGAGKSTFIENMGPDSKRFFAIYFLNNSVYKFTWADLNQTVSDKEFGIPIFGSTNNLKRR